MLSDFWQPVIETAQYGCPSHMHEPKKSPLFLIDINACSQDLWLPNATVAQRQDWRSTIVKRLRARTYLRDKPVYR